MKTFKSCPDCIGPCHLKECHDVTPAGLQAAAANARTTITSILHDAAILMHLTRAESKTLSELLAAIINTTGGGK